METLGESRDLEHLFFSKPIGLRTTWMYSCELRYRTHPKGTIRKARLVACHSKASRSEFGTFVARIATIVHKA